MSELYVTGIDRTNPDKEFFRRDGIHKLYAPVYRKWEHLSWCLYCPTRENYVR